MNPSVARRLQLGTCILGFAVVAIVRPAAASDLAPSDKVFVVLKPGVTPVQAALSLAGAAETWTSLDGGFVASTTQQGESLADSNLVESTWPMVAGSRGLFPIHPVQVLVEVAPGSNPRALADDYDLQWVGPIPGLDGQYIFAVSGRSVLEAIAALTTDARVLDARPDRLVLTRPEQVVGGIEDPLYPLQWHLADGEGGINAAAAWQAGHLGAGVIVGMLDDAVDMFHEDLASAFIGVSHATHDNSRTAAAAEHLLDGFLLHDDHGTAVMGLIAAVANNVGVRGVAPNVRFTASSGVGGPRTGSQVASAYAFALDQGVEVHNNSWSPIFFADPTVSAAVRNAANNGRDGLGMVIVFSAGNSRTELRDGDHYATMPEVIQVGATDRSDTIAVFSNYGPSQDVMAAGVADVTVDRTGPAVLGRGWLELDNDSDYTADFGGTSAAAPVVSGVAALMLSANNSLTRLQVLDILRHTAEQIKPFDANYNPTTGFSNRYGYGRVNAAAAVEAAASNIVWPGVPADVAVEIVENEDSEGNQSPLLAEFSWVPDAMQGRATDEQEILLLYLDPTATTGGNQIQFQPDLRFGGMTDAQLDEVLDAGSLNDAADGSKPDLNNPAVVVLYRGPATSTTGERRVVSDVGLLGDLDEQVFAIYAISASNRFSYGYMFNQDGDPIFLDDDEQGGFRPPPDDGDGDRPIPIEGFPGPVGVQDPPQVGATSSVSVCTAPCSVTFHGDAVTPNQLSQAIWDFGDGTVMSWEPDGNQTLAEVRSVTHTYQAPSPTGEPYQAVFLAMSSQEGGMSMSTRRLMVDVRRANDDELPTDPSQVRASVEVRSTEPFDAPALVRFTVDTSGIGEASDSRVAYEWDFGDGHTATGLSVENVYETPGFYSVLVTVRETRSNGQTVQVTASTIVQIRGAATGNFGGGTGSNQEPQEPLEEAPSGGGSCGATGLAMISLAFAGLSSLRWGTRRRR